MGGEEWEEGGVRGEEWEEWEEGMSRRRGRVAGGGEE